MTTILPGLTAQDEIAYGMLPVVRGKGRLDVILEDHRIFGGGSEWVYRCRTTGRIIVITRVFNKRRWEVDTVRLVGLAPAGDTPYDRAVAVSDALIRIASREGWLIKQ